MKHDERELLTFKEAARLTGVSERTLARMVVRGELSEFRFGHAKRLSRAELLTPRPKSAQRTDRRQV